MTAPGLGDIYYTREMQAQRDERAECSWCDGTGHDSDGEECPECLGSGVEPEPDDDPPEPLPYDGPMPEVEW